MKTFKILFAAIVIAGFASSAMGQVQTDAQEVSVSANIIREITHVETIPLQFGVITLLGDKTLAINGDLSGTNENFIEDVQVGRVHWDVGNNANVSISFAGHNDRLTGPGSATLGVSYVAGFNTADNAEAATPIDNLSDGASTVTDGNSFYVWLAGTVEDDQDAVEGEYTGEVTISLIYN